ncbi:beta-galactosidase [Lachnospiraceae bacterium PM6-15]|uniref:glycoside hydrolase family 2 protein n=1 Tax=Ohessyouella blattaphilus TaxID=2949333 RepID=UPI003E2B4F0B
MRKTIHLVEGWKFGLTNPPVDTAMPELQEGMETVCIPHVWNLDKPSRYGCGIYQYSFNSNELLGEKVFVEFGAVANVCKVWLNGIYLGEHRGGYSCFRFELTEALCQGENILTVTADNKKYEDSCPVGGDFNNYGGIYRDASLIYTGKNHFDLLYFGSSGLEIETHADGSLCAKAHVIGTGKIIYTLWDGDQVAAQADATWESPEVQMKIENPHLWNGKKDPYLYRISAELYVDAVCVDQVSLNCGFRKCEINSDNGFLLNDQHVKLNGVAKHQDCEGVGNGPSNEQLDTDMQLILEVGANAVRLSHYQHPQYFYDLCDQNGLLVWAEIPMLGMPDGNTAVVENAKQQMRELIIQNKHRPSIFCWGIQNETSMYGESLELYHKTEDLNTFTKSLDSSRYTTSANLFSVKFQSQLNFIPDITAYNAYFGWYHHEMDEYDPFLEQFHAENPQIPLGISEYGVDGNPALHSATPKRKDYSEEFQALFHETVYPKMRKRDFVWGTFVWNMFDFGSVLRNEGGTQGKNCKGLVTFDRKLKKDVFYYYKACWSEVPFIHVGGRRFVNRCGETTTVKVYSNQKYMQLYVNGNMVAELQQDGPVFTFENVPLTLGENTIRAVSGAYVDEIQITGVTEPEKSYIYVDPNPEYNVKNWFAAEQSEEDLFPEDRYSVMTSMRELMADPNVTALLEKETPELYEECVAAKKAPIGLLFLFNRKRNEYSEDYVKEMNKKLRNIKKPKTNN